MRKRCTNPECGFECPYLEADQYFYTRNRGDGYCPQCKECDKARCKRSREENPEKWAAYQRAKWRRMKTDPERASVRKAQGRERMRRLRDTPPERYQDSRVERVDAAPVLAAVEASGVTLAEVAGRIGRDREGLKKLLHQGSMSAERATAILAAIGVLPAEIGL